MHLKISSVKCQPFCSGLHVLTHWGRVTHICISNLTIMGLDNGLSPGRRQLPPSHCLNQRRFIVNWTLVNIVQWNFNWNSNIFIQENVLENVVWKMSAILSRPQCVNVFSTCSVSAGHQREEVSDVQGVYLFIWSTLTQRTSSDRHWKHKQVVFWTKSGQIQTNGAGPFYMEHPLLQPICHDHMLWLSSGMKLLLSLLEINLIIKYDNEIPQI